MSRKLGRVATAGVLAGSLGASGALAVRSAPPNPLGTYGMVDGCDPVASVAGTRVDVTLTEWAVTPMPSSVAVGRVGFVALNAGLEPHELVVVRGTEIPVDGNGALDESRLARGALVGEIEPFASGTACGHTLDLTAGSYTLLCNIVEEEGGVTEAHFALGMAAPFTVTG